MASKNEILEGMRKVAIEAVRFRPSPSRGPRFARNERAQARGQMETRFVVWLNSLQVVCKLAYLAWSQTCALACEREVHKFENSWKLTLFVL